MLQIKFSFPLDSSLSARETKLQIDPDTWSFFIYHSCKHSIKLSFIKKLKITLGKNYRNSTNKLLYAFVVSSYKMTLAC